MNTTSVATAILLMMFFLLIWTYIDGNIRATRDTATELMAANLAQWLKKHNITIEEVERISFGNRGGFPLVYLKNISQFKKVVLKERGVVYIEHEGWCTSRKAYRFVFFPNGQPRAYVVFICDGKVTDPYHYP